MNRWTKEQMNKWINQSFKSKQTHQQLQF
jgi:hypothetical protein